MAELGWGEFGRIRADLDGGTSLPDVLAQAGLVDAGAWHAEEARKLEILAREVDAGVFRNLELFKRGYETRMRELAGERAHRGEPLDAAATTFEKVLDRISRVPDPVLLDETLPIPDPTEAPAPSMPFLATNLMQLSMSEGAGNAAAGGETLPIPEQRADVPSMPFQRQVTTERIPEAGKSASKEKP